MTGIPFRLLILLGFFVNVGASTMTDTILITGANRGIGLEFVKQYAMDEWNVIACCRDPAKAKELQQLAKTHPSVQIATLDVSEDASIHNLASQLKGTSIDVLINNAGVYSGTKESTSTDQTQAFGHIDSKAWEKVLRINTIAPIMVIQSLMQNLKKGAKIVNITSIMGSLAMMNGGLIAYRSSKTALNSSMCAIAADLKDLGLTIVNIHPGWVITDMGGQNADITAQESVTNMRQVIGKLKTKDSGRFLNYDGQTIPW